MKMKEELTTDQTDSHGCKAEESIPPLAPGQWPGVNATKQASFRKPNFLRFTRRKVELTRDDRFELSYWAVHVFGVHRDDEFSRRQIRELIIRLGSRELFASDSRTGIAELPEFDDRSVGEARGIEGQMNAGRFRYAERDRSIFAWALAPALDQSKGGIPDRLHVM